MTKILNSKLIGLVIKRLSIVEADTKKSNQHELNGNRELKRLLGNIKLTNKEVSFNYYFGEGKIISTNGAITWYDAREAHPTRSEYRLYFKSNSVMDNAEPGDLLVVAIEDDGEIVISVIQEGSKIEENLLNVFGPLDYTFKYKSL
jgi:hypothetical protein